MTVFCILFVNMKFFTTQRSLNECPLLSFKIVIVFMFLFRFLCLLELIFVEGVIDGSSFIPSPVIETLDSTRSIY